MPEMLSQDRRTHKSPDCQLLIQMSGAPGSGKTTTAELLAPHIGAVIIPHDIIKSKLLESGMSFSEAGKTAYSMDWALTESIMRQGHSVIVDTPCLYPEILGRGRELALKYDFMYWYVELSADLGDLAVLDARLRARLNPLRAQRVTIDIGPVDVDGGDRVKGSEESRDRFRSMVECPCRPDQNVIMLYTCCSLEGRVEYILGQIFPSVDM